MSTAAYLQAVKMARARNIKPGFFQNEKLAELSPLARLAFIGMWTIADFKGCIEYRPKRLKVQLLPYDECSIEEIAINLERSGFISIYSVEDQSYIKIVNFDKHQNPHKNERDAGSEIPDIPENYIRINELKKIEINREENGTARADSLFLIPSSLIPDSLLPDSSVPPSAVAPVKPDAPKKKEPESAETWRAYSNAYFDKYGTEPVRNATTNSLMAGFVKRIGVDESPHVARFYLSHNNAYYIRQMHDLKAMVADAEKLRTEWATNTQMTSTRAIQQDRTQTNYQSFNVLIEEARREQ